MSEILVKSLLSAALVAGSIPALAYSGGSGVYSVFDANADGFVDREEFQELLKRRHIKQPYHQLWRFEAVDQDGDGRISEQEMLQVLQKEVNLRKSLRKNKQ